MSYYKSVVIAKKLRTGEHASPPAGYPTKRSLYAVPEKYIFPIDTPSRVHAALSYFTKHSFASPSEKKRAAARILRAARKFKIKIDPSSNVAQAARA